MLSALFEDLNASRLPTSQGSQGTLVYVASSLETWPSHRRAHSIFTVLRILVTHVCIIYIYIVTVSCTDIYIYIYIHIYIYIYHSVTYVFRWQLVICAHLKICWHMQLNICARAIKHSIRNKSVRKQPFDLFFAPVDPFQMSLMIISRRGHPWDSAQRWPFPAETWPFYTSWGHWKIPSAFAMVSYCFIVMIVG